MKIISDPADYKLNNISFRVSSAKVMEEFKAMQGFVLSEIQFGQYRFSAQSKEMALLYLDSAFRILLVVEQIIVRSGKLKLDMALASDILHAMLSQIDYMEKVVIENPKIFNAEVFKIWREAHFPVTRLIERVVEESVDSPIEEAFRAIGAIGVESIDTVRFELYEIDYILNDGKAPFVVITELCKPIRDKVGISMPAARAKVYKEKLKVDKKFGIKNYTNSYVNFVECASEMKKEGIDVVGY